MNRARVRLVLETETGRQEILAHAGAGGWTVDAGGDPLSADATTLPDGRLSLILEDGRQICGRVTSNDSEATVQTARGVSRISIRDPKRPRRGHRGGDDSASDGEEIRALMPGRVIEVAVAEAQAVDSGALILVLEAMKMQNEIRASRAGIVERVDVAAGQTVEAGALMVRIGPSPAGGESLA